jgi:hypothetical protein
MKLNNTSVDKKQELKMENTIINDFLTASIKVPSYEPSEQAVSNFGEWIIANPIGTYKEWKLYLNNIAKKDSK